MSTDAASAIAADARHPLRDPSFRLLLLSRICSAFSFQAVAVAVGWLVYDRTGSAFDLGLIGLFQFLPMLALTLPAGHVADRFDRRRIVLICQAVEVLAMAALAVALLQGSLSTPAIFTAIAVLGSAQAFERPTVSALLPRVAPPATLHQAIALASSAQQTAFIIGPSLGGLLYGLGAPAPFIFAAAFFAVAALAMLAVKVPHQGSSREPPTLKSIFSGVSFIASRPIILGAISLDLFAVLLGGVTALLPMFARDILHAGPWELGLLRSAPAIGGLAMSIILARASLGRGVGRKMFAAVIVFGIATIVFSLSTNVILSIIALLVIGASDNISVVVRSSLVQLSTPDEMRGRVSAVNSLFIGTSNQLGEFESGMVAGFIGPVAAGVVGGVGVVAVALLWMRLFPALRKADTLSG